MGGRRLGSDESSVHQSHLSVRLRKFASGKGEWVLAHGRRAHSLVQISRARPNSVIRDNEAHHDTGTGASAFAFPIST